MNIESDNISKICCKICNKQYKSTNSLWNHNNRFHKYNVRKNTLKTEQTIANVQSKIVNIPSNTNNNNNIIQNNNKSLCCEICNKIFNCRSSKSMHKKKCQQKLNEKEAHEIKMKELETEVLKLKLKLKTSNKITSMSFKSLNKMLKNRNYINNSNNTNNTNNSNNTTNNIQNNINLVSFGKDEHLVDFLTKHDQKSVMYSGVKCIEKLIDITYNGPSYNQFKNILITNLKDNFAYKYDDKLGYFVIVNKTDTLKDFIETRIFDIEEIYNKLSDAKKIDDKTKNTITKFLDKIQNNTEKFIDTCDNITYPNYKDYKINKIKILLYNNQDKITKDLALYFLPEENIEL